MIRGGGGGTFRGICQADTPISLVYFTIGFEAILATIFGKAIFDYPHSWSVVRADFA
jgi:hypothetical protein